MPDFPLRYAATSQLAHASSSETPERLLAAAVLQCAVDDVKNGRVGARARFTNKGKVMRVWCKTLGLDVDMVAERVAVIPDPVRPTRSNAGMVNPMPEQPEQLTLGLSHAV